MDPVTILSIVLACTALAGLITREVLGHVKKSKCWGVEIEMNEKTQTPDQQNHSKI